MNKKVRLNKKIDAQKKKLLLARRAKVNEIGSLITARNKFYITNLRFLIVIWLLLLVTIIFFIIVTTYSTIREVNAFYVQAKLNGQQILAEDIRKPELDGKEITDQEVVEWVLKAIPSIYNYSFNDGSGNFRDIVGYFTPSGYKAYVNAVKKSKLLETIAATGTVSLGVGCGNKPSYVITKGQKAIEGYGVYTWDLDIPFVSRNISAGKNTVRLGHLRIGVQRVPQLLSRNGLAIWQFIFIEEGKLDNDAKFIDLCQNIFGE